jgi:hypothetical protein
MTPELETKLVKRYPEVFKDAGGDPARTCMAWGLAVGDGWYDIIDTLCGQFVGRLRRAQERLEYLQQNVGKDAYGGVIDQANIEEQAAKVADELALVPVAAQVKEKFGGLRFYTDGQTPEQSAMISFAEALSERTCEECGAPGMLYPIGWVRALCTHHADKAHGVKAVEFRAKRAQETEDLA